jgi:ribonuclease HIII
MQKELNNFIAQLLVETEKNKIVLIDSKDIQYGQQLRFSDNKSKVTVNIYFSTRKGISKVLGGKKETVLHSKMNEILFGKAAEKPESHKWNRWAGTDESGKGDFFGPLVVCGFVMEKKFEKSFKELGIQDSKKIRSDKIVEIAEYLYKHHRRNFELIILKPQKYNELYTKFNDQKKKLNELLAWMHGRVILNLNEKTNFEGAVIDKFARERTLKDSLKDLSKISLIQRVRAEDDMAVACSSILARYNFVKFMDKLSADYQMEFPKGAAQKVIDAAAEFASKYGKERLREVAKIHFKTYKEI